MATSMLSPDDKEFAILQDFCLYPVLTAQQILQLHYSANSMWWLNKVLTTMCSKGLLQRPERPNVNMKYFYYLGSKGKRALELAEYTVPYYNSRPVYPFIQNQAHMITTNDVMMQTTRISAVSPEHEVWKIQHDLVLKKQHSGVRPDVLADIHKGDMHVNIWVEIEMGSAAHDHDRFRRKIRNIIQFIDGDYPRVFGNVKPVVLLMAINNEKWRDTMITLTNQVLDTMYTSADLFRIASIDVIDTQRIYFDTVWRIPGREGWVSLF